MTYYTYQSSLGLRDGLKEIYWQKTLEQSWIRVQIADSSEIRQTEHWLQKTVFSHCISK